MIEREGAIKGAVGGKRVPLRGKVLLRGKGEHVCKEEIEGIVEKEKEGAVEGEREGAIERSLLKVGI